MNITFFSKGEIIINKKLLLIFLLLSLITSAGCQAYTSNLYEKDEVSTKEQKSDEGNTDLNKKEQVSENDITNEGVDSADVNKDDQDKDQQEADADGQSILSTQKEYILSNKNPIELKEWMNQVMDKLSIEDATTMVAYYEEYLIDLLPHYQKKFDEYDGQNISLDKYTDIKREDIKVLNDELKSFLDEIYDAGYKLKTSEGYLSLVIDYTSFSEYKDKISDGMYDYFTAMSLESEKSFASDGGVMITWDELAYRINVYENYLNQYPDSMRKSEIEEQLLSYMQAYIFGLENSPLFDYNSKKVNEEILESYKNSIEAYPNTRLAEILNEYIELLEDNNYELTDAVGIYQTKLGQTLRDRLDNKTNKYYGLTIEKKKAEHEKHDIIYPILKGMEDQGLQEKINRIIYEKISPVLTEKIEEEFEVTYWNDYHVQRFDEDILSITFYVYSYMEGAAHPMHVLISTNIDLNTGEEYSLDELFEEGYDYKKDLYERAKKQIEQKEILLLAEFEGIGDEQEFYLTPDELVVYYQTYTYTPYAYGPLQLYFKYDDLDKLTIPTP